MYIVYLSVATLPAVLEGKCKTTNLACRSTVEATGTTKQYIRLTSNTIKERFTGHKASFTHCNHAHKTTISSHIWELKDEQTTYNQHWSILIFAISYSRRVRICQLCLMEKKHHSLADHRSPRTTLNKKNGIVAKCCHRDKVLLKHW